MTARPTIIVRLLLLLLIGGAIVNVAVAWGMAALGQRMLEAAMPKMLDAG